jgi:CheY-like chemotaxis protein
MEMDRNGCGRNMKILIVEDNASVRRLIRRAIADLADEVIEREDGSEALEVYRAHHPDIVLMDVKMPRMDGLRATRVLLEYDPSAKVIIVTDYNDDEIRAAAREAGACAFALKHDLTDLEALLEATYAGRQAQD